MKTPKGMDKLLAAVRTTRLGAPNAPDPFSFDDPNTWFLDENPLPRKRELSIEELIWKAKERKRCTLS